ncbi:GNAT family N-acetyltransferase, partial [Desulfosarcina sp. OttesenSCG-928-G10]|nr:GNAT family N-acetyltransferase [Desulfosarcina sp. OttesenSCG-928-G10]
GIVVGCVEKKIIDEKTVELGALAISARFLNQRVGVYTVKTFMGLMAAQGYTRFISLTNNPRLAALYHQMGFAHCPSPPPAYAKRQEESPGVNMFFRSMEAKQ